VASGTTFDEAAALRVETLCATPDAAATRVTAYDAHVAHCNVPRMLGRLAIEVGLAVVRREVVPILNASFHPNTCARGTALFIGDFVVGSGLLPIAAEPAKERPRRSRRRSVQGQPGAWRPAACVSCNWLHRAKGGEGHCPVVFPPARTAASRPNWRYCGPRR
jgi:hypothetical protein